MSTSNKNGLPDQSNNQFKNEAEVISLWSPNRAASASVLLTPIFGAWIHAKNWKALGNEAKAKKSMNWIYGMVTAISLGVILAPDKAVGIIFWSLVGWYFILGKQQAKYIQENLSAGYREKNWGKPVGFAVLAIIAFAVVAAVVGPVLGTAH